ncbi:hypothetical protein [Kitasatospora sp. NPDC088779]|uniref:hypothetical protein n=1 Tax=Kitasatospora sp. NPDC088779 TaxID=3154964 RepID=UPI00343518A6
MTGQPTGGQWQWPQDAWQPPPVPTGFAPAPVPAPAPASRRSRKVWAAATVGTVAVLAAVLAMCGPGSGDELDVVALPHASPSASDPAAPDPPAFSPLPTTPAPSPLPPPTPQGAGPALATATAAAAPNEDEPADAQHAATAHPKPGRTAHPSPSAHGASPAGATPAAPAPGAALPTLGAGGICDQAERVGRWPAGSEQARLCHSIYG